MRDEIKVNLSILFITVVIAVYALENFLIITHKTIEQKRALIAKSNGVEVYSNIVQYNLLRIPLFKQMVITMKRDTDL